MQPTLLKSVSPRASSPRGGAGYSLTSDSFQMYATVALISARWRCSFSSPWMFSWKKKCGIQVVGWKSRGASIHL